MKLKTFYIWGAPLSKQIRKALLAEMREATIEDRFNQLSLYLNRITDKTGGVLAIAGFVLAICTFVLDKAGDDLKRADHTWHTELAFLLCVAGVGLSMLGIFFLCTNLFTSWRPNWKITEADTDRSFTLFCRRAIKLQISLYGIMAAAILSCSALGLLEYKDMLRTEAVQIVEKAWTGLNKTASDAISRLQSNPA